MDTLKIGTRKSPLALWQANYIKTRLLEINKELNIELVKITTQGDKFLNSSLSKLGGKGLFIKELEQGLLANEIDLAVHSTKDMTTDLPSTLHIGAICQREDPRDVFISNQYGTIDQLPDSARVGTSSLRRQCQLRAKYSSLTILPLRGNINTRLEKLDQGNYDGIILAAAGIIRMGFEQRIKQFLNTDDFLPAAGQGAICIESRKQDHTTNSLINALADTETTQCVQAERALIEALQGGCQLPIAAHATIDNNELTLRALVGDPDGSEIIRANAKGSPDDPVAIGLNAANQLLNDGANKILGKISGNE